jgi:hypothetical protein
MNGARKGIRAAREQKLSFAHNHSISLNETELTRHTDREGEPEAE